MIVSQCRLWVVSFLLAVPLVVTAEIEQPLVAAAKARDVDTVASLLQGNVNADSATPDGTTALHWAAHRDEVGLAETLLQAGADPDPENVYGVTPLFLACTNRSTAMVETLLQHGSDPDAALDTGGQTVLMECARTGAADAVAALLSAGVDIEVSEGNKDQTALMWAVAAGHSEVVRLLVEAGAKVSRTTTPGALQHPDRSCRICTFEHSPGGFTPLLFAAQAGDLETARILLEAGADPNEASPKYGNSLVVAAAGGFEDLALYLLEQGADPDAQDENGMTALHYAIGEGLSLLDGIIYDPVYRIRPDNMRDLARALLEAGADPNKQIAGSRLMGPDDIPFSMQGATPLLLTATAADVALMQMLREYGANPELKTNDGITPLMAAAQAACLGTCAASDMGQGSISQQAVNKALEAVKAAVSMGIDVNARNENGETAMHKAAFTGSDPIVKYLAENGAEINVKNNDNETPWTMAKGITPDLGERGTYGEHDGTAALLVELGASTEVGFVPE